MAEVKRGPGSIPPELKDLEIMIHEVLDKAFADGAHVHDNIIAGNLGNIVMEILIANNVIDKEI